MLIKAMINFDDINIFITPVCGLVAISTFSNTKVLFYKYNNKMPYTINETKIGVKFLASKLVTIEVTGKLFYQFQLIVLRNYYRRINYSGRCLQS